jgi:hypothetical protein
MMVADDARSRDDDLDVPRGYRERSTSGKREPHGLMRFNLDEWLVIEQVAALAGKTPGAWVQKAAYETAVIQLRGESLDRDAIVSLIGEMRQHRRVLTNIGGNLNDVAKVANATGLIESANVADTVLKLIRNVVSASDDLVLKIRTELLA